LERETMVIPTQDNARRVAAWHAYAAQHLRNGHPWLIERKNPRAADRPAANAIGELLIIATAPATSHIELDDHEARMRQLLDRY